MITHVQVLPSHLNRMFSHRLTVSNPPFGDWLLPCHDVMIFLFHILVNMFFEKNSVKWKNLHPSNDHRSVPKLNGFVYPFFLLPEKRNIIVYLILNRLRPCSPPQVIHLSAFLNRFPMLLKQ